MSEGGVCKLCGRIVSFRTRHHLVPRTRHANKRNKREFERDDVKTRIVLLCPPCHEHVHALFTEKELERDYNTMELLSAQPEIARFVQWIRKKPDGFKPISYESRKKGR